MAVNAKEALMMMSKKIRKRAYNKEKNKIISLRMEQLQQYIPSTRSNRQYALLESLNPQSSSINFPP